MSTPYGEVAISACPLGKVSYAKPTDIVLAACAHENSVEVSEAHWTVVFEDFLLLNIRWIVVNALNICF